MATIDAPKGYSDVPQEPKRPETGAVINDTVSITFAAPSSDGYDQWPYTYTLSRSEAIKVRDALNALEL